MATNTKEVSVQVADVQRKKLVEVYRDEPKVPMYLSPMYKPYFGNVMQVSINGICIFFKVDGTTQLVPETFADEIVGRRLRIDQTINRLERMSDVTANNESNPGELKLF